MNDRKESRLKAVVKSIGAKSSIAALLVFLLTIAATCAVGYRLYRSTKENIKLQGKVNAVEAAKEFDGYLLVRKSTVILSGDVVEYLDGGENGFLHVKYGDTEGYVLATCLEYADVNPSGRNISNKNSVMQMQQVSLIGGEGMQGGQTVTATATTAMATEKKVKTKI